MIIVRPFVWIATLLFCALLGLAWCGRRYGWDTFTVAALMLVGLGYAHFSLGG